MKLLAILLLLATVPAYAADPILGEVACDANAAEMAKIKALVKKGKEAFLKDEKKTKDDITAKSKDFMDGSIYLYVYDGSTCVAHGQNGALVGKDLKGMKDDKQIPFIVSMNRLSMEKKEGCIEYLWPDPDNSGKKGRKIGYLVNVKDSIWIGSGYYPKN